MTRWRPVLYAIGLLVLGMLYVRACWEPSIRADERKRAGDRRDDSTVARLAYEIARAGKQLQRERDSTGRVIHDLLERGRRSAIARPPMEGPPSASERRPAVPATAQPQSNDVRDSLIASLLSGRQQDSLQLLFWKAQVQTRDSLIPRLQQARDDARRQAAKPRHTMSDILGGAALGYGLAKENEIAAATGGALILAPRVVDLLGRVF